MEKRLLSIIKTTNNCNLNCEYCYNDNNRSNDKMNTSTLKNVTKKLLNNNLDINRIRFLWHGGEPLMAGIDFFENALDYQKKFNDNNIIIKNNIQTNGTLISDDYINFLSENNFSVSLSIDGPKHLHGKTRKNMSQENSFDMVMSGLKKIKDAKIQTGALLVLNKNSLGYEEEIYNFIKDTEIDFKINPIFSINESRYDDLCISESEYYNSLKKYADMWISDENPPKNIEPLFGIARGFFNDKPHSCTSSGKCHEKIIAVETDGSVYPCGRSAGDNEFYMGNLNNNELKEIYLSEIYDKIKNRSKEMKDCPDCNWLQICNGGCYYISYQKTGDINQHESGCESKIMFFEYFKNLINNNM